MRKAIKILYEKLVKLNPIEKLFAVLTFLSLVTGIISNLISTKIWTLDSHINPVFEKLNSGDSLNILITNFDDYYNRIEPNSVGKVISTRIYDLIEEKKLPIKVAYADSLRSPQSKQEAKKILKENNGEVLIYGLFKPDDSSKVGGLIRFKTVSYNLVEDIKELDPDVVEKYEKEWRPFNPTKFEEKGIYIDSVGFDNWIQSLIILKKRKLLDTLRADRFLKYHSLYREQVSGGLESKRNMFYDRARLNHSIENYYDAIFEIDSAIFYGNQFLDSLTVAKYVTFNSPEEVIEASKWHMIKQSLLLPLEEVKYHSLSNFQNPTKAISLLDQEIEYYEKGLSGDLFKVIPDQIGMQRKSKSKKDHIEETTNQLTLDALFSGKGYTLGAPISINRQDLNYLYSIKTHLILKWFDSEESIRQARETHDKITFEFSSQAPNAFYLTNALVLAKKEKDYLGYNGILALNDMYKFVPQDTLIKYTDILLNYSKEYEDPLLNLKRSYVWFIIAAITGGLLIFFRRKSLFRRIKS